MWKVRGTEAGPLSADTHWCSLSCREQEGDPLLLLESDKCFTSRSPAHECGAIQKSQQTNGFDTQQFM